MLLAIGAALAGGLVAFSSRSLAERLTNPLNQAAASVNWAWLKSVPATILQASEAFAKTPPATHLHLVTMTGIGHGFTVAGGWLAIQAAGIEAPASAALWLISVVTLSSLVPFTIAGFGVRELGVTALMVQWYNTPSEPAVLLSLALGAVGLLASAGLGGVAVLAESLSKRTSAAAPPAGHGSP